MPSFQSLVASNVELSTYSASGLGKSVDTVAARVSVYSPRAERNVSDFFFVGDTRTTSCSSDAMSAAECSRASVLLGGDTATTEATETADEADVRRQSRRRFGGLGVGTTSKLLLSLRTSLKHVRQKTCR